MWCIFYPSPFPYFPFSITILYCTILYYTILQLKCGFCQKAEEPFWFIVTSVHLDWRYWLYCALVALPHYWTLICNSRHAELYFHTEASHFIASGRNALSWLVRPRPRPRPTSTSESYCASIKTTTNTDVGGGCRRMTAITVAGRHSRDTLLTIFSSYHFFVCYSLFVYLCIHFIITSRERWSWFSRVLV